MSCFSSHRSQILNAGNLELSFQITHSPIYMSFLTSPTHVPTWQPLTMHYIMSYIKLIISNSKHMLVPFPQYNIQQIYIIRIVLSSRT